MTDDLVQFLRDRLDEDEKVARAADGDEIEASDPVRGAKFLTLRGDHHDRHVGELPSALADHIARHDPARIIAEVEMKRSIVEKYERALDNSRAHPDDLASSGALLALHGVVHLLAAPHANHPQFRQEWRP
ncbi:MAG: DUF6221 family protein [Streptomyces sp.]|jgi:hypothetical protein|nr:DUF6221 family protein [Streptomyces sp.]